MNTVGLTFSLLSLGNYSAGSYFLCHRAIQCNETLLLNCFLIILMLVYQQRWFSSFKFSEKSVMCREELFHRCSLTVTFNNARTTRDLLLTHEYSEAMHPYCCLCSIGKYLCKIFLALYVLQKVIFVMKLTALRALIKTKS